MPSVRPRTTSAFVLASALAASLMAACGHNQDVAIQKATADSTGAPLSSMKDSGLAAGNRTLDSLHQAGVTPKNGIDSAGSKAQADTRNEPGRDTSRLNNRATPGAGPAAPAGTAPGSTRP